MSSSGASGTLTPSGSPESLAAGAARVSMRLYTSPGAARSSSSSWCRCLRRQEHGKPLTNRSQRDSVSLMFALMHVSIVCKAMHAEHEAHQYFMQHDHTEDLCGDAHKDTKRKPCGVLLNM